MLQSIYMMTASADVHDEVVYFFKRYQDMYGVKLHCIDDSLDKESKFYFAGEKTACVCLSSVLKLQFMNVLVDCMEDI